MRMMTTAPKFPDTASTLQLGSSKSHGECGRQPRDVQPVRSSASQEMGKNCGWAGPGFGNAQPSSSQAPAKLMELSARTNKLQNDILE